VRKPGAAVSLISDGDVAGVIHCASDSRRAIRAALAEMRDGP